MNRLSRTLLTAAALAAALGAGAARADHDDGWRRPPPRPVVVAPPVVVVPAAPVWAPRPWSPPVVRPVPVRWEGPRRALVREYRELDGARARFYATWRGNPWARDRFEHWYADRRAELDHRWAELDGRGHERW